MEEFDTDYQEHIICPHCGHQQSDESEHSDEGEYWCGECGKNFYLFIHISINYTTEKRP